MLVQKLSWIILLLFLCQHGVEAKRIVACEGGFVQVRCVKGLIKVTKANYGRTNRTTCSHWIADDHTSNMCCFQGSSLQIMSTRCDARKMFCSCNEHSFL